MTVSSGPGGLHAGRCGPAGRGAACGGGCCGEHRGKKDPRFPNATSSLGILFSSLGPCRLTGGAAGPFQLAGAEAEEAMRVIREAEEAMEPCRGLLQRQKLSGATAFFVGLGIDGPEAADFLQASRGFTAAIPTEKPCWSCRLTRVRPRCRAA